MCIRDSYSLVLILMMIFRPGGLLGSYDFSMSRLVAVSYTQLDVYKRQLLDVCNGMLHTAGKDVGQLTGLLLLGSGNRSLGSCLLDTSVHLFHPGEARRHGGHQGRTAAVRQF